MAGTIQFSYVLFCFFFYIPKINAFWRFFFLSAEYSITKIGNRYSDLRPSTRLTGYSLPSLLLRQRCHPFTQHVTLICKMPVPNHFRMGTTAWTVKIPYKHLHLSYDIIIILICQIHQTAKSGENGCILTFKLQVWPELWFCRAKPVIFFLFFTKKNIDLWYSKETRRKMLIFKLQMYAMMKWK